MKFLGKVKESSGKIIDLSGLFRLFQKIFEGLVFRIVLVTCLSPRRDGVSVVDHDSEKAGNFQPLSQIFVPLQFYFSIIVSKECDRPK
jgi:hypothetical protein